MQAKKPSRYHRTDLRIVYSQLDDAVVQRGRHPRPDGVEGQALHPSRLGLELGQHGGGQQYGATWHPVGHSSDYPTTMSPNRLVKARQGDYCWVKYDFTGGTERL